MRCAWGLRRRLLRRDADSLGDVLNDLLISAEGESHAEGEADVAHAASTAVASLSTIASESAVTLAVDAEADAVAFLESLPPPRQGG